VSVVAGGSLAKLGMKFQGHREKEMPVLEDVIGGVAFLVTGDDGVSPVLRLDLLGKYPIGAGGSQQRLQGSLILAPLKSHGLKMTDIDQSQMNDFSEKRGLVGFAPTQGHIPAGIPYIAHGIREILEGKKRRIMIVAKGSPFLTRMTNLSDGLSFVLGKN